MNIPMYSALSMLVHGKALYKNIIIIIIIIITQERRPGGREGATLKGPEARAHSVDLSPGRLFGQSQPSVGREGTNRVYAGLLAKAPCPLSPFFLHTSVFRLPYVKKNGLVDTGP